jgi:sugar lactone lactonase YvrE
MQSRCNFLKRTLAWGSVSLACLVINACGGGGGGSVPTPTPAPPVAVAAPVPTPSPLPTPAPALAVFAGTVGVGNVDGIGAAARFSNPVGIATDSAGNVYVADAELHTIRKITPGGMVSTFAGKSGVVGSTDGAGAAATFRGPGGMAIDGAGNLYVTESNKIRKITPAGVVSTLFSGAALVDSPDSIAIDRAGNFYVTEYFTVRKITPVGDVTTLAGAAGVSGAAEGTGGAAKFRRLDGIAVDSVGNVYVADGSNFIGRTNTIRKITPGGVVTTLVASVGVFYEPHDIAIDSADNLYVTDGTKTIRKITPTGVVTTLSSNDGGSSKLTTDSAGNVYVADRINRVIRKITPTGVDSNLAGPGTQVFDFSNGSGAYFSGPTGIAADNAGNLYVTNTSGDTISKVTPSGLVTRLAGQDGVDGRDDGTGSAASFGMPFGIVTDSVGNVYVIDASNTIRKITPSGVVSTLAGTVGVFDRPEAGCRAPVRCITLGGIAMDSAGNFYLTDGGRHVIHKVTPAGVVSTFAGMVGVIGSADGVGPSASFNTPRGIAMDSAGNLYVSDDYTIRKITPAGLVSTLAGTAGAYGYANGIGAAARFGRLDGIAVDSAGNLYAVDADNYAVRKVTPNGLVSTLVGGVRDEIGFIPGALPGGGLSFPQSPRGVAVIGTSLYITMENGIAVVTNLP